MRRPGRVCLDSWNGLSLEFLIEHFRLHLVELLDGGFDGGAVVDAAHEQLAEPKGGVADEDFGRVRMQGLVPRFKRQPGKIRWTAKSLAADNDYIYREIVGLDDAEIERYKAEGII